MWTVWINRGNGWRDSGIAESNLGYYIPYWMERARVMGYKVKLQNGAEIIHINNQVARWPAVNPKGAK